MVDFLTLVVTHPLFYIGALLAFGATFGFLLFLRGFLSGLNHLLHIDGEDEYLEKYRLRATWGMVMMVNMFIVWVAVRGLVTLVGYDTADLSKTSTILISYGLLVAVLYFMGLVFKKEKH